MKGKNNDSWSRYHKNRLLIFGLFVLGFGIYQLSTLLTFKSQLTDINGVLSSADTYVTTVTERSRGTKSQKSERFLHKKTMLWQGKVFLSRNQMMNG